MCSVLPGACSSSPCRCCTVSSSTWVWPRSVESRYAACQPLMLIILLNWLIMAERLTHCISDSGPGSSLFRASKQTNRQAGVILGVHTDSRDNRITSNHSYICYKLLSWQRYQSEKITCSCPNRVWCAGVSWQQPIYRVTHLQMGLHVFELEPVLVGNLPPTHCTGQWSCVAYQSPRNNLRWIIHIIVLQVFNLCHSKTWALFLHLLLVSSSSTVLGQDKVVHDAIEAPAGLFLPPSCSSEEGTPVHTGPDHLSGCALDPEIHLPGHHLPRDGTW